MKKFAVRVALDVITTGAIAKACDTARIGVDASAQPLESTAVQGQTVGFNAHWTPTGIEVA
jgi:histidine transport system substrate-binding protein